jgi:hypothetical protein
MAGVGIEPAQRLQEGIEELRAEAYPPIPLIFTTGKGNHTADPLPGTTCPAVVASLVTATPTGAFPPTTGR